MSPRSKWRLYVANLPWSATENDVRELFSDLGGDVLSVKVCTERETGRSRGFGFVEVSDERALLAGLAASGRELGGRRVKVERARDSDRRPR